MTMTNAAWYSSNFPEAQFVCRDDNRRIFYGANVIRGLTRMQQSNTWIVGIARNVEKYISYSAVRIIRLGEMFHNYRVFIYENDSIDNTKELLHSIAKIRTKFTVKCEDMGAPVLQQDKSKMRRHWMAVARNKYLEYIRNHNFKADFVIVVDMDVEGGWSYEGVANSFGKLDSEGWDVCGSNGLKYHDGNRYYYDEWAFRKLGHPLEHKPTSINNLCFERGDPLVHVNSCFGGLAIYTSETLLDSDILYTKDDCDHPTINNRLTNRGYKIVMNPSQITLFNRNIYQ